MRMQVNASKKTLIIVMIFCLIAVLGDALMMTKYVYSTKDYVATEAEITDILKYSKRPQTSGQKKSKVKKVQYEYTFNDVKYEVQDRTFVLIGKHEGDIKTVYVNAENPAEIRSSFIFETGALFLALFGFAEMFCIAAICQTIRDENRRDGYL